MYCWIKKINNNCEGKGYNLALPSLWVLEGFLNWEWESCAEQSIWKSVGWFWCGPKFQQKQATQQRDIKALCEDFYNMQPASFMASIVKLFNDYLFTCNLLLFAGTILLFACNITTIHLQRSAIAGNMLLLLAMYCYALVMYYYSLAMYCYLLVTYYYSLAIY
jgi:hypothetical protein